jgi:deoxyadenosine/deoxycytidine kinase
MAVVGPIGVGKSTLAAIIARRTGATFVPERFEENPFLARFYAPGGFARWGFHTEAAFLTQRHAQTLEIAARLNAGESIVTDFTPQQNLLFARITVDPLEFTLYEQLFQRLMSPLPMPDRLVCLDADVRTILRRIRKRARDIETDMPVGYLRRLRTAYAAWRTQPPAPALWIETDALPIPTDLVARATVLEQVTRALEGRWGEIESAAQVPLSPTG